MPREGEPLNPIFNLVLGEKGLIAMNSRLSENGLQLGPELVKASSRKNGPDYGRVGDLFGGIVGGFIKSLSSS